MERPGRREQAVAPACARVDSDCPERRNPTAGSTGPSHGRRADDDDGLPDTIDDAAAAAARPTADARRQSRCRGAMWLRGPARGRAPRRWRGWSGPASTRARSSRQTTSPRTSCTSRTSSAGTTGCSTAGGWSAGSWWSGVHASDDDGDDPCKVRVTSGYALDPYGNEIVVAARELLDLCKEDMLGMVACLPNDDPWCRPVETSRTGTFYLAVRYRERAVKPVHAPTGCSCKDAELREQQVSRRVRVRSAAGAPRALRHAVRGAHDAVRRRGRVPSVPRDGLGAAGHGHDEGLRDRGDHRRQPAARAVACVPVPGLHQRAQGERVKTSSGCART